jgi:uncharacterized phosphosugar-binding protein
MKNYAAAYFQFCAEQLGKVERESGASIQHAAELIADAIQQDREWLLFGSGHSALVAHEATGRAGGLAPAVAIEDVADGDAERLEGMAHLILGRYDLRPGSVLTVISHSGINAVPIEAAMIGREAGLKVIVITAVAHSERVPARHSSGKKLYELGDVVIDTHGVVGDTAIELPEGMRSGATSTVVGAAIIQALTVQTAGILAARGTPPPVVISSNILGGDAHNQRLMARYRPRMVRYQVPVLVGTSVKEIKPAAKP